MKFTISPAEDSNITFYNLDDGNPVLIIEPNSFYVKDGEIIIDADEDTSNEIQKMLGL